MSFPTAFWQNRTGRIAPVFVTDVLFFPYLKTRAILSVTNRNDVAMDIHWTTNPHTYFLAPPDTHILPGQTVSVNVNRIAFLSQVGTLRGAWSSGTDFGDTQIIELNAE